MLSRSKRQLLAATLLGAPALAQGFNYSMGSYGIELTITGLTQCGKPTFAWTGGKAPYSITSMLGSSPTRDKDVGQGLSGNTFDGWVNDYPEGTMVSFVIQDEVINFDVVLSTVVAGTDTCSLRAATTGGPGSYEDFASRFASSTAGIGNQAQPSVAVTGTGQSSGKVNVGAIVGGTVGGVVVLLAIGGVFWLRRKRKAKAKAQLGTEEKFEVDEQPQFVTPFGKPSPSPGSGPGLSPTKSKQEVGEGGEVAYHEQYQTPYKPSTALEVGHNDAPYADTGYGHRPSNELGDVAQNKSLTTAEIVGRKYAHYANQASERSRQHQDHYDSTASSPYMGAPAADNYTPLPAPASRPLPIPGASNLPAGDVVVEEQDAGPVPVRETVPPRYNPEWERQRERGEH